MAAVQPLPDDEIAAELAGSWGPDDDPPPRPVGSAEPVRRREAVVIRRGMGPADRPGRPDPTDLRRAAERVAPVTLARERVLPLAPAFAGLLPAGLPRGATVLVGGPPERAAGIERPGVTGTTALALALVASASAAGSWVALVGLPALGLRAAAELGVALERLVVVETPPVERWGTVVGSLVGAFDVVILGAPARAAGHGGPTRVRPAEVRRLAVRARERGTVLMPLGGSLAGRSPVTEADLRVAVGTVAWEGLADGHGLLRRRRVTVEVTGRRAAARVRRAELWLPDGEGRVRLVEPVLGRHGGQNGHVDGPEREAVEGLSDAG